MMKKVDSLDLLGIEEVTAMTTEKASFIFGKGSQVIVELDFLIICRVHNCRMSVGMISFKVANVSKGDMNLLVIGLIGE